MIYTVNTSHSFWLYYDQEDVTLDNFNECEVDSDDFELNWVEILDEDDNPVASKEYIPEGCSPVWQKGTIIYGTRHNYYEIEADNLSLEELEVRFMSIKFKDQEIWEIDADDEIVDVIHL